MLDPVEQCSACRQTLWGRVRYCPFCGAQAASSDAAQRLLAAADDAAIAPDSGASADSAPPPQAAPEVLKAVASQPPERMKPAQQEKRLKPDAPQAQEKAQAKLQDQSPKNKLEEGAGSSPAPRLLRPSRKLFFGAALVGMLVYWFWDPALPVPDACDQSLAQVQSSMAQENAQQARQHSQAAIAVCQDTKRLRLAKTAQAEADALLKAQAQGEQQARRLVQRQAQQQAACEKTNQQTASLLQSARLESASKKLALLDAACRETGATQALSAQLQGMQATASKATTDAHTQLAAGVLGQARTSIEVLASVNRESTDLPELRSALNKAQAAAAVTNRPAAAAPPAQTELVRGFIRDAETHMQQRLYDKAKAYAESAQRIDPRNPEVTSLLRRIKEHEMNYLRERIVIE